MVYIYIRKTQFLGGRFWRGFWIGFAEVLGLILERFLERFWSGFGEVVRDNFDIFVIQLCISRWKGFGKDFGQILT